MPSQTFLNLDSKKQQKLLDAAMEEFSTVRYTEASVNHIIQQAGIPRGSFYMYFVDKDDLFSYILELNKKKIIAFMIDVIRSCQGNLEQSFLTLFDVFTDEIITHNLSRFLKNMFLYFSMYREKFERPGHDLFLQVKDVISTEELKEDDLEIVFHLFMHNLFVGITEAVKTNKVSDIRKQYRCIIHILCYGIYKEDKRC